MSHDAAGICAACQLTRSLDDLLAFWPVGDPAQRRFVCRVTRPSPVATESCFRQGGRSRFTPASGPALAAGGPVVGATYSPAGETGCALAVPA